MLGVNQCDGSVAATKGLAVTSQSWRRQEELSEHEQVTRERESGAVPNPLEKEEVPYSELDEDLFTENRGRPRLSKRQKCENSPKQFPQARENPGHPLEVSLDDLVELQKLNKSLKPMWR